MEQVTTLFMQYPTDLKCSFGNESFSICCTKNCKQYPFQCRIHNCSCWSKIHKDCMTVRWESIATKILGKKKKTDDNFIQFTQEIEKIYEDVIQKFIEQRQQFRDWVKYFGLSKTQRKFANLIAENSVDKLTGQLMSQILPILQDVQQFIRPQPDSIKQYWIKNKKKLNSLSNQIRDVYLYPSGFFPLTLKQHEQRIIKLFTKKPNRFKLIYQGSKNNFSIGEFHKQCDNVQNTLSVVELTDGRIAGGYTPVKWQSSKPKWVSDPKSQTFKFIQEENSKQLKKNNASTNAVYQNEQWGPSFGAGRDLIIFAEQTNTMTSFTVPSSYQGRSYDLFCPVGSKINQAKKFVDLWVFNVLWFD